MAAISNTSSLIKSSRHGLNASLLALAFAGAPLAAQDVEAPPSLEELIPDSAVESPEEWASAGADEQESPSLDTETPIEAPLELAIPWPDDIEIESFDGLEAEEDIEFADLDLGQSQVSFDEAETERLGDTLVLGFPQTEPPFSERGDFVERFEALSTIEQLENDDANVAQLAARAREDEELLNNLLQVYGYYDGQVIRSFNTPQDNANVASAIPTVRFDILPGERYRYGAVDLGNLAAATDAESLREAFGIYPGDYLQSDTIVQEQFDLDRALGENGYPFATIDEPQLLIDHDRNEGDLTLAVEPNGKYVFGEVTSSDPEFLSSSHLATIARFEPGDTYKRSLSMDLRRAVTATGLVSTVDITPREVTPPQGDQPGVVDMDVELNRAKLRTIAGAIGYGTEEGFRLQASWEHRNLFPPEGALRLRGVAGTREQMAGITFRKNNFTGRDRVLTLDAYGRTLNTDAYDANTVALSGTFEKLSTLLFQKPISWATGLEILATDERNRVIGGVPRPRRTYFVGSIFGRATLDTTDSLLDPTQGFRIGGFIAPEVTRTADRNFTYFRLQADGSYYQSVSDRVVLAGRGRFATIQGSELFGVPPSRRLYAGGGGSVRGYGYEKIGPTNDFGEATGGASLVEASIEARIRTGFFDGAVSIVPFFDAGAVSIDSMPDFRFVKYGAGVGLRYATGFGPLRVDVATPLNPDPDDAPIAVYVSLGQAF